MRDFDENDQQPNTGGNPDSGYSKETQDNDRVNNQGANGTYYTPPKQDNPAEANTTYHYAYRPAANAQNTGSGYTGSPSGAPVPPDPWDQPEAASKKKNKKTVITIVSILVVCIIVAIVGIVLATTGFIGTTNTDKQEQTTAAAGEDTKTQNSASVPTEDESGNLTVAGVAKKVINSCVGIEVYANKNNAYNNFYGYGSSGGGNEDSSQKSGEGSGVIMREDGGKTYILTCAHVISGGDKFVVTLNDGTEVDAKLVGYDSQTDIGVLSIDKTGLQVATFAKSENLVVGEQVVAIGCPGGLEFMNSVTSGYISALGRPIESSSIGYDNECIQTDAAINPGNSGGALFNMQGQVIGINSSKIASTEYEGMGFSVPSTTAVDTANSLIKVGYVEGRAKIGITYNAITNFSNASSIINALAEKGFKDAQGTMVINEVSSDSDLANKDIKQYDMIVAVNGKTMTSADVLTSILADSNPGDTVKLTIARIENDKIKTFEVSCKLIESKGDK